jgi:hypothetical protein
MRQPTNHEMGNGCHNVLQAAIHLKKAKFRSEGWGAPQVLSVNELEKLRATINERSLLEVKQRYELMHFVIDSWMEWDIKLQHPRKVQRIQVVSFSPDSARERNQPYPDALVKLGCSILKIRNDVYGDARTYSTADCPDFQSIH